MFFSVLAHLSVLWFVPKFEVGKITLQDLHVVLLQVPKQPPPEPLPPEPPPPKLVSPPKPPPLSPPSKPLTAPVKPASVAPTSEPVVETPAATVPIPIAQPKPIAVASTPEPTTAPNIIIPKPEPATVTPKPTSEPSPMPPSPAPHIDNSGQVLENYTQQLWERVNKHRNYPEMALRRGWQGQVILELNMDRNGNVMSKKVLQSSGYKLLDKRALEMLELALPFSVPPELVVNTGLTVKIPVSFKLEVGAGP